MLVMLVKLDGSCVLPSSSLTSWSVMIHGLSFGERLKDGPRPLPACLQAVAACFRARTLGLIGPVEDARPAIAVAGSRRDRNRAIVRDWLLARCAGVLRPRNSCC